MRAAALFSGGKDSAFAVQLAREAGHSVESLLNVVPASDESHLLHYASSGFVGLQAESMGIPLVQAGAPAGSEEDVMRAELEKIRGRQGIRALVHGGILSRFQRDTFARVCADLGLEPVAPLWGMDQEAYMRRLVSEGYEFVMTEVGAGGLDESWLGRTVTAGALEELLALARRHSFNPSLEGGEGETFVTMCPLFSRRVLITGSEAAWDGCRGRFEIRGARLAGHA